VLLHSLMPPLISHQVELRQWRMRCRLTDVAWVRAAGSCATLASVSAASLFTGLSVSAAHPRERLLRDSRRHHGLR